LGVHVSWAYLEPVEVGERWPSRGQRHRRQRGHARDARLLWRGGGGVAAEGGRREAEREGEMSAWQRAVRPHVPKPAAALGALQGMRGCPVGLHRPHGHTIGPGSRGPNVWHQGLQVADRLRGPFTAAHLDAVLGRGGADHDGGPARCSGRADGRATGARGGQHLGDRCWGGLGGPAGRGDRGGAAGNGRPGAKIWPRRSANKNRLPTPFSHKHKPRRTKNPGAAAAAAAAADDGPGGRRTARRRRRCSGQQRGGC
jgi:hypothetical protein